jgi:outer membrane receptor protein involved in Fe transport
MKMKSFSLQRQRSRTLEIVASIMAIGMAGAAAHGQTTNAPAATAGTSTNAPAATSGSSTNVTQLGNVTVVGKLDVARNQIVPDLGATVYTVPKEQITAEPLGEAAPINQVLLRTPGMAEDSAPNGDLHLRGEHANIQYRINDVLLPEGLSGFGQELDTRFVDSLRLITGSLPAQYGFRTAGVVDIHTKSGAFEPGGEASLVGGSYNTISPSGEFGGSEGNLNYFGDFSYDHNDIGIENPTGSDYPIHDTTDQYKGFVFLSYVLDDTSRVSFMGSASYADFEVPNVPNQGPGTFMDMATPFNLPNSGLPATFDSTQLNERQNEQNYYGVVAYQKSVDDLNLQVAAFGRNSSVHFMPDPVGDLFFNGVAADEQRSLYSGGVQTDLSYQINDQHTVRAGFSVLEEYVAGKSTTTVFQQDPVTGAPDNPLGAPPFDIGQDSYINDVFGGIYLQDEWKILPKVTLNYGARWDIFYATFDKENQPSPRVNLIYQPTDSTTLHAGYARYFTPPAPEFVSSGSVAVFHNTSNFTGSDQDDPIKAERANYYDAGISQKLAPGLQVGVDGYYKTAKEQIDDGLFGQSLILSTFNYAHGEIKGVEFTTTYTKGGFSGYGNIAVSDALGEGIDSAQFLLPAVAAYTQGAYIHLDHDQRLSVSSGLSYLLNESRSASTLPYVDLIYGSGLRDDLTYNGVTIPNGASVPDYYTINMGVQQDFKLSGKQHLKLRFDVVNVTDNTYELRNGTGVGVNAPEFGERRGYFGSISYVF